MRPAATRPARLAPWLLLTLACASNTAQAQTLAQDQAGPGALQPEWQTRISSFSAVYGAGAEGGTDKPRSLTELRLQQRLALTPAPGQRLVAEVDVLADSTGTAQGVQALPTRSERPRVASLGEAYYRYDRDNWRITVGRQRFDWATTDTVSPSDLLNPRDWSDITRVRKLAVPALSLRVGDGTALELVLTPGGQSILPQGRWQTALPAGVTRAAQDKAGSQAAARLSGNWWQTDLSLVAYRGPSYAPAAALDLSATGARLRPYYDEVHAISAGLAREVFEGSVLRAEWGRFKQQRGDDFDQWVTSLDREFTGLLGRRDSLYVLAQFQSEQRRREGQNLPGWWDFRRVFNNSLMARAQYSPGDDGRWQLLLEGTWQRTTRQRYTRLVLKHRLAPALEAELGVASIAGQAGSFWGSYAPSNQAFVALHWQL